MWCHTVVVVRGLKEEKQGENEDKEGVGTVGRDGLGQELMRLGGRWMADTEREMRERLGLLSTFSLSCEISPPLAVVATLRLSMKTAVFEIIRE